MSLASDLNQMDNTLTALLEYANGVTGASDVSVGDAIHTLADGYGQGGGGSAPVYTGSVTTTTASKMITLPSLSADKDYVLVFYADTTTLAAIMADTAHANYYAIKGVQPILKKTIAALGATITAATVSDIDRYKTSGAYKNDVMSNAAFGSLSYLYYPGTYIWEIYEI